MKKRFFIAGTDTDAGKTFVTSGLLRAANRAGLRTIGLKPVAAGASLENGRLVNDDALQLQRASSVNLPYEQVNPIVLEAAIAPHIAAAQEGRMVTVSRLEGLLKGSMLTPHELCCVEGAGGWRVPLNDREFMSDLAITLALPVILVVNMKLGCLNHARLTLEAIARDGLTLAGWIANDAQPVPMSCREENLLSLQSVLPAPFLGEVPWQQENEQTDESFDQIFTRLFSC
ncbi:dethiobiotin synthase [Marinomonas epiphytica]